MAEDPVIEIIARALEHDPDNVRVRLHFASLLLDARRFDEAREHLEIARRLEPGNDEIPALHQAIMAAGFDWDRADAELVEVVDAPFATPDEAEPAGVRGVASSGSRPVDTHPDDQVTLADVGGMEDVKRHLELSFLAPLRNPTLSKLYGTTMRGGLLLYGPPGCGKTYLARAIAGELGFTFISATPADLLDPYMGMSERAISGLFRAAREAAPCILFLDEVDGLGGRRSSMRLSPGLRNAVSQLLVELDGVGKENHGVYVLAATNQPWDVDPALRRPGRFDRTLLVLPPDAPAREAIFLVHLRNRPLEGIQLATLAAQSDGMSGADIAYACDVAAQNVLMDSLTSGTARTIRTADVLTVLGSAPRSTRPWFESARAVVAYGSDDGTMTELAAYMKRSGLW
jgi:SpoVK/Ycf46/Vps4 family AAA+-type ATPase